MAGPVENVLLIVVDALRTDRVGVYGGSDLTPNIDSIADDGEVFEQCYSCINATDSSLTTILTGTYPTHHGVLNHGRNITDEEQQYASGTTPLAELLSDTHHTIGVDTLERWHARGFEEYMNPRWENRSKLINVAADAVDRFPSALRQRIQRTHSALTRRTDEAPGQVLGESITDLAIDAIESTGSPLFLFTHYWDTHLPYVPPENCPDHVPGDSYEDEGRELGEVLDPIRTSPWSDRLENKLSGESTTVSELKSKYDAGVWNADRAIGRLIETLKQRGLFEETAIIVTADHGESFTEHGILFDHHGLYDPTIHVPLIIRAPGFDGREREFVQHFDIVPTVLDLLGKEFRDDRFDGVSLSGERTVPQDRGAIYAEEGHTARKRAIRTRRYKYIRRLDDRTECRYCEIRHAADEELYDLATDPDEERNIATERPELRDDLDARLESWVESLPDSSKEPISFELNTEVEEHLEDMGYM